MQFRLNDFEKDFIRINFFSTQGNYRATQTELLRRYSESVPRAVIYEIWRDFGFNLNEESHGVSKQCFMESYGRNKGDFNRIRRDLGISSKQLESLEEKFKLSFFGKSVIKSEYFPQRFKIRDRKTSTNGNSLFR